MILLFSQGGKLSSPLPEELGTKRMLEIVGATLSELNDSLKALRDTLVRLVFAPEESYWTYRHPTIHDAISVYVSEDPELVGIYLRTSGVAQILSEVYFVGARRPPGAHMAVPRHLYVELVARIVGAYDDKQRLPDEVLEFLIARADDEFLRQYALAASRLRSQLIPFWSYRVGEFKLLERLHAVGLLAESVKARIVEHIKQRAAEHEPDADWLDSPMFSAEERAKLLAHIRTELASDTDYRVDSMEDDYDSTEEPEDYFESLVEALEKYKDAFQEAGDSATAKELDTVLYRISNVVSDLEEKYEAASLPQGNIRTPRLVVDNTVSDASRFDDLDE
jgi:hypothetical protein